MTPIYNINNTEESINNSGISLFSPSWNYSTYQEHDSTIKLWELTAKKQAPASILSNVLQYEAIYKKNTLTLIKELKSNPYLEQNTDIIEWLMAYRLLKIYLKG